MCLVRKTACHLCDQIYSRSVQLCDNRFPSSICLRQDKKFRKVFDFSRWTWTFSLDAQASRVKRGRFLDLEPLLDCIEEVGACDKCGQKTSTTR